MKAGLFLIYKSQLYVLTSAINTQKTLLKTVTTYKNIIKDQVFRNKSNKECANPLLVK